MAVVLVPGLAVAAVVAAAAAAVLVVAAAAVLRGRVQRSGVVPP
ncbi:hypothetical protein HEK616_53540 [Streptomyces nigrescens]|uniref:Uncharacterized protein n=1 Tax=Streptomyces nigrescens TaxID=1920 RepID=A0ABM7ZZR8_STRNI|nr:hypothetical protein HEK616_53540 [Streptomyces nigrescens]